MKIFMDAAGTEYPSRASVEQYKPAGRPLYYRAYGRFYLVSLLAADAKAANDFMLKNPDEALLAELEDGSCVIAKVGDGGIEELPANWEPETDDQVAMRLAIGSAKKVSSQRLAAIMAGVSNADAELNNIAVPTYSEALLAMRSLVAWVDSTGLVNMPAFAGMLTEPLDAARGLVKKAGL